MSDLIVYAATDLVTNALNSTSSVALITTALKTASSLTLAILTIVQGLLIAVGTYLAGLTAKAMFLHIILALGFTDAGTVTGS